MILQINDLSWAQLGHHSGLNWDYLISTGLDSRNCQVSWLLPDIRWPH